MAAQTQVSIRRERQFFGFMRSLPVYIDGRKLGELKSGEQKTFAVPPGEHELYVKMDWCKSKPLRVSTTAGEAAELVCGSPISGLKILIAAILVFLPERALFLRRVGDATA
jgi:hypothetical protein